jgi:hypothetical protein
MAEAFVKTFKRDYIRANPTPTPQRRSLRSISGWRNNTVHPHSSAGLRLTTGVYQRSVSTRRLSGLTGSTLLSKTLAKFAVFWQVLLGPTMRCT